ncbi:ABC transporter permease, partial [Wenxinia marina]
MSRALWGRIATKTAQSLATLIVVVVLVFLLVRLSPGDPVRLMLGSEGSDEAVAALTEQLALDRSIPEQFLAFVTGLLRGDLGNSLVLRDRSVIEIILSSLPVTLAIIGTGLTVSVVCGVSLGLMAAISRRPSVDLAVRTWAMLLYATPTFLIGLVLVLVFALRFQWLPAGGWPGAFPENVVFLVLPGLALSGYLMPVIIRTVRQAAIDVSGQLFIEAALARGLSGSALTIRHILPNSLLPVVTLVGINLGALLTGAIIV